MMNNDLIFTITTLILFSIFGATNIFVIVYLRSKLGYRLDFIEFVRLYLGDINNYIRINKEFRKASYSSDSSFIYKSIAVMHLVTPILIVISILCWLLI